MSKTKSEGASILSASVPNRKKSDRLMSMSSAVSSVSSVSSETLGQMRKRGDIVISPVNSNDFDNETVSEQMEWMILMTLR